MTSATVRSMIGWKRAPSSRSGQQAARLRPRFSSASLGRVGCSISGHPTHSRHTINCAARLGQSQRSVIGHPGATCSPCVTACRSFPATDCAASHAHACRSRTANVPLHPLWYGACDDKGLVRAGYLVVCLLRGGRRPFRCVHGKRRSFQWRAW